MRQKAAENCCLSVDNCAKIGIEKANILRYRRHIHVKFGTTTPSWGFCIERCHNFEVLLPRWPKMTSKRSPKTPKD